MTAFTPELVRRLERARRVAALTGAGISAESGVPTFRDPDGLWARFRPEELASMDAFLQNPARVQEWYRHRRTVVEDVRPNAAHRALVDLAGVVPSLSLITQNVDNLHQQAGQSDVIELHGNLTRNHCAACGLVAGEGAFDVEPPFRCRSCGGLIRPDVVWFGEMLPPGAYEAAHRAAVEADVFLSVGTSAVVHPAAGLPLAARRAGAYVAEFNTEPSAIADLVSEVVLGPAGQTLPALVNAILAARQHPTDA